MTKVVIAISASEDDLAFLVEIRNKYHQKNLSGALHILIKEHSATVKYAADLREKLKGSQPEQEKTSKKPSNPMVDL